MVTENFLGAEDGCSHPSDYSPFPSGTNCTRFCLLEVLNLEQLFVVVVLSAGKFDKATTKIPH